jgi:mannose-6-phosphate isomerase-like protein (cupin superfamily)
MKKESPIFLINIEQETNSNQYYRDVLFTSTHQQLVVMNLLPGEEIERESHPHLDQFIRIEKGHGQLIVQDNFFYTLREGDAVIIPAKTIHYIQNMSQTESLKLYTLYSPPNHPPNLRQERHI